MNWSANGRARLYSTQPGPPPRRASSPATITRIRLPRLPLTSTASPGRTAAATIGREAAASSAHARRAGAAAPPRTGAASAGRTHRAGRPSRATSGAEPGMLGRAERRRVPACRPARRCGAVPGMQRAARSSAARPRRRRRCSSRRAAGSPPQIRRCRPRPGHGAKLLERRRRPAPGRGRARAPAASAASAFIAMCAPGAARRKRDVRRRHATALPSASIRLRPQARVGSSARAERQHAAPRRGARSTRRAAGCPPAARRCRPGAGRAGWLAFSSAIASRLPRWPICAAAIVGDDRDVRRAPAGPAARSRRDGSCRSRRRRTRRRPAAGPASAARPNGCCRTPRRRGSGRTRDSTARSISLVVVLPTLPVTATTRPAKRARPARPSAGKPASVSATTSSGASSGTSSGAMHHRARGAASRARRRHGRGRRRARPPAPRTGRRAAACGCRSTRPVACERRASASPPVALRADRRAVHSAVMRPRRPGGAPVRDVVERQRLVAPIVWPCSWPLPATTSTSPGRSPLEPGGDRAARGRRSRARRAGGQDGGADARPGPRVRGLSSVTIAAVGQPRGDRAHQRPLAAVAVAAGAEHQRAAARPCAGAAPAAAAPARPACGRNRHRPRRRSAARRPAPSGRARRAAAAAASSASAAPVAAARPGGEQRVVGLEPAGQRQLDRAVPPSRSRAPGRPAAAPRAAGGSASPPSPTGAARRPRARRCRAALPASSASSVGAGDRGRAARQQLGEQAQLGRAIGLERAVIVEMVAGQIAEPGGGQPHARPAGTGPARATTPRSPPRCTPSRASAARVSASATGSGVVRPAPPRRPGAITPERAQARRRHARAPPRAGAGTRPCWSCRWCR